MANEASFWKTLRRGMRPYWTAVRHENIVAEGVPDLSFDIYGIPGSGWIELKHRHFWPKCDSTIVKFKHYSSEQKAWIKKHGALTNRVYLFLQVGKDYLLFNWKVAHHIGSVNKEGLFLLALKTWRPYINYKELAEILNNQWRVEPWDNGGTM